MKPVRRTGAVLSITQATLKELGRERLALALTLLLAPLLLVVYRLIFLEGMVVYRVGVHVPPESAWRLEEVGTALAAIKTDPEFSYADGNALYDFVLYTTYDEGETRLRDRSISVLLVFPPGSGKVAPELAGDFADPYYTMASVSLRAALAAHLRFEPEACGTPVFSRRELGRMLHPTPFGNYVPGLLAIAGVSGLFVFAMLLARERETTSALRYRLSGVSASAIILGKSLAFLVHSGMATLLALCAAWALDFQGPGLPPSWMLLVWVFCLVSGLGAIGLAFIAASLSASVFQALYLAALAFLLLVFFSGSTYPLPEFALLSQAGVEVRLFDFLPTTHAVRGLHRLLAFGDGLPLLAPRLLAAACTAAGWLCAGGYCYARRVLGRSLLAAGASRGSGHRS